MLKAIAAQPFGLFVDDGSLALGIGLLVGAIGTLTQVLPASDALRGAALLVDCLAILGINTLSAPRR
jgi:hypothetical protein